jgi:hypothetical protein
MVEKCISLGYYAANSGNCNYHYSLRNNPDERSLGGGRLNTRQNDSWKIRE